MHPERRRREIELAELTHSGQWELLYQNLVLREFPYEARMGWQLAFLRTLAVPRMARLIYDTGEMLQHTRKRVYDTGLIIYELVHAGVDSPTGHRMASLMNRAHHGQPIEPEDMTYVLTAFIVAPIRHIEKVGRRAPTRDERHAAYAFFARLGQLMNIDHIPANYAETEKFFDDYEATHIAPSRESVELGRRLIDELKIMQPWPVRPLAAKTFTALLDNPPIAEALGLPEPGCLFQGVVAAVVKAKSVLAPHRRPRSESAFTPGQAVRGVYPHGYTLDDLRPSRYGHTR